MWGALIFRADLGRCAHGRHRVGWEAAATPNPRQPCPDLYCAPALPAASIRGRGCRPFAPHHPLTLCALQPPTRLPAAAQQRLAGSRSPTTLTPSAAAMHSPRLHVPRPKSSLRRARRPLPAKCRQTKLPTTPRQAGQPARGRRLGRARQGLRDVRQVAAGRGGRSRGLWGKRVGAGAWVLDLRMPAPTNKAPGQQPRARGRPALGRRARPADQPPPPPVSTATLHALAPARRLLTR